MHLRHSYLEIGCQFELWNWVQNAARLITVTQSFEDFAQMGALYEFTP
jgi:hypothetical protein